MDIKHPLENNAESMQQIVYPLKPILVHDDGTKMRYPYHHKDNQIGNDSMIEEVAIRRHGNKFNMKIIFTHESKLAHIFQKGISEEDMLLELSQLSMNQPNGKPETEKAV